MEVTQELKSVKFVLDESAKLTGWPSSHYWCACTVCGMGLLVPIDDGSEREATRMPVHVGCLRDLEEHGNDA